MKLKPTALAIALLSPLSFPVMAEVTLELPDNIRLLAVNETEVNKGWGSIFKATEDSITLEDGKNQIVYQVDHYFYKGDKQSERYRSGPLILTFTANNEELSLAIPNFSDKVQAESYAEKPTPKLTDAKSASYPFKHDHLALKGLSINHDYAEYVKAYNQKGGVAAVTGLTAPVAATKVSATEQSPTVEKAAVATKTAQAENKGSQADLAGENLKYWFEQADPQTRKEFVSWAVQNL
ncbi:DUF2057 domain-containing protein [Photobacterium sanctipauli]|uniref:UPF0319 protein C9I98_11730 n=1 Tax=Photobacterium sanctipauli TaxID=1342794 RepID=A0A2T3NTP4_9GAMM|nr:DUF2057 domain-containing protein [Photobacterium sanctipauli]PSW19575.1 DUF2057 domain-containing protein [Photobacterium sanctipauli]